MPLVQHSSTTVNNPVYGVDLGTQIDSMIATGVDPAFPPPKVLPCANVKVIELTTCPKPGTMACGQFILTTLNKQKCQREHWSIHKQDCKNIMRSSDWMPIWLREGRRPSFMTDGDATFEETISYGVSLWGNTPAVDVINLRCNEDDDTVDLSVAFPASGDLRHVVHTVNSLPDSYSGNLKILINDHAPFVTSRNIVLLLILTTIPDRLVAADIALHFWYSVFMPYEYSVRICAIIAKILSLADTNDGVLDLTLDPYFHIICPNVVDFIPLFRHYMDPSMDDVELFQASYSAARQEPSKADFRDRTYLNLRPSHRVAFQEYRRFGIVLPFGAINTHFNFPNRSLFSNMDNTWLQTGFADPLEGWHADSIIAAGKKHGATEEDIYGCLYFFLSDELQTFAQRLRTLKISVVVSNMGATALSLSIQKGRLDPYGIPGSSRFHRIHVSNIFDFNYIGLIAVLEQWGPLLEETKHAVLLGYLMNWVAKQEDGRVRGAGERAIEGAIKRMKEDDRVTGPLSIIQKHETGLKDAQGLLFLVMSVLDIYHDNSKAFSVFLEKQGVHQILSREKLVLRQKHTIVPHRFCAPIDAQPDALPQFPNANSWYYYKFVTCSTAVERYVEFSRY